MFLNTAYFITEIPFPVLKFTENFEISYSYSTISESGLDEITKERVEHGATGVFYRPESLRRSVYLRRKGLLQRMYA
ncbi:hypothetical protein THZG08_50149 [Vibrio owensii]|nr:hypothetical protein THZG08_50149 [Vibrio owensii]CAH1583040.1 hypothetical protein THOA03_50149 [Vibrio owensii]